MQLSHGHLFLSDRRSPCLSVSLHIANEVKIASLGGIEAIIKAMSTHKDHIGVQENTCGVLRNLAVNNDGTWICSFFFFFLYFLDVYSFVFVFICYYLIFFCSFDCFVAFKSRMAMISV